MSDATPLDTPSPISPEFEAQYRELVHIRMTLQHGGVLAIRLLFLIAVLLLIGVGFLAVLVAR